MKGFNLGVGTLANHMGNASASAPPGPEVRLFSYNGLKINNKQIHFMLTSVIILPFSLNERVA